MKIKRAFFSRKMSSASLPMPGWMFALILAAIPFVFVVVWMAVAFVTAHIGGWATLSREFATQQPAPASNRFGAGRISMGAASYRGGVSIVPEKRGLWISMTPMFRFAHPSMLVPWRAVSSVEERSGAFGSRFYKFTVQSQSASVKITFYNAPLAKALNAARETHLTTSDEP